MQFSHLCSHLVHNFLHFFFPHVHLCWGICEAALIWSRACPVSATLGLLPGCLSTLLWSQLSDWILALLCGGFWFFPITRSKLLPDDTSSTSNCHFQLKKSQTQAPGRKWVCHVFAERQAALDPLISVPILVSLGHKYVASFSESMCLTLFWNLSISLHFLLFLWADGRCCEYRQICWLELSSEMMIHFRDGKAWERES